LIEQIESRLHAGNPVLDAEIHSARQFLQQNDFSPSSDYFSRLGRIQSLLVTRPRTPARVSGKRNYGGEAGGQWMQVQSAFDHVILSTVYEGDFNLRRGRVKISHRFNQAGRIDFVELKFLASLEPRLNGELRKLLLVKDYQNLRRSWHEAEAFVLPILPRELVFLYEEVFHCPKAEVLGWLVNIGHRITCDLVGDLAARPATGFLPESRSPSGQLDLELVREDDVAWPILESASALESSVDLLDPRTAVVRYASQ
jgi:hypothetical protein